MFKSNLKKSPSLCYNAPDDFSFYFLKGKLTDYYYYHLNSSHAVEEHSKVMDKKCGNALTARRHSLLCDFGVARR